MAEWSKAAVLKTVGRKPRGFESYLRRQVVVWPPRCLERWPSGRRRSPAKRVHGVTCVAGPNPALSAVMEGLKFLPIGDRFFAAFGTAPVAQLDRASDYGSEGWGFEPLWARLVPFKCLLSSGIG